MDFNELVARNLAAALLAADWRRETLDAALATFLGRHKRTRGKLALRLVKDFEAPPSPARLAAYLLRSSLFNRGRKLLFKASLAPPLFAPAERFAALALPKLATPGELAEWLGLAPGALDWFADSRRTQARAPLGALRHYHHLFIAKSAGPPRLLEAPKARLKIIQRKILHEMLDLVPVHAAAQGFVRRRSCIDGAARHAGERFVMTFDLANFFFDDANEPRLCAVSQPRLSTRRRGRVDASHWRDDADGRVRSRAAGAALRF